MSKQNIYDDEVFFDSYKRIRDRANANEIIEMPSLFNILPPLNGLSILDMGSGYGEHCIKYVEMGASKVIGIDISEKMLQFASRENSSTRITYKQLAIEDLHKLNESFDLVVSSLTLHYVEDFSEIVKQVHRLLNDNGRFIFSQEHPFSTCFEYGDRWTKDEKGNKIYANISNYSIDGRRESRWFKDGIIKYHRTFASILNTMIISGFLIEQIVEPIASDDIMKQYPEYNDNIHKPDFLLIKAIKQKF